MFCFFPPFHNVTTLCKLTLHAKQRDNEADLSPLLTDPLKRGGNVGRLADQDAVAKIPAAPAEGVSQRGREGGAVERGQAEQGGAEGIPLLDPHRRCDGDALAERT